MGERALALSLKSLPPVVPPPPDTLFELPSVPDFGRPSTFCRGGGGLLKIAEETSGGNRAGGEGFSKRKAAAGPSSADAGHSRKKGTQPCNMYAATERCKWPN